MLLLVPAVAADANVTVEHEGAVNFALASLIDLGCDGNATLQIDGGLRFVHGHGTSCAAARLRLPLPLGADQIEVQTHHARTPGDGLLAVSVGLAGDDVAEALAPAHAGPRANLSSHTFPVAGDHVVLEWRFDATGQGGDILLDDLWVTIVGDPVATPALIGDPGLDGDFVDERRLEVVLDATPVAGLRPSATIVLDDEAVITAVVAPDGAILDIGGHRDRIHLAAPLLEMHGSGQYSVAYRVPDPVAAQGGLIVWFGMVMATLLAAGAVCGYLVVRHQADGGRARIVATGTYAVLVLAGAATMVRVLFTGDVRLMVQTPLSSVATIQYVVMGILAIAFGVLALILGAGRLRHLMRRLRLRVRQTQELEEAQEQLETFTAAAAHDLRAPLRAISGHIALAKRALPSKHHDAVRFMDRAVDGVKRMDELVTALLDHSRVASAQVEPVTFHVEEAAQQALHDLQVQIRGRGADVAVEGEATLHGDPRLVRQAIQNLVQNAIKYSDGEPWVRIRLQEDHHGTHIRVVDRGRGIPEAEQESVVEAFHRGSNGHDRPGTGLGLATVRKILEMHDGDLSLQSVEGQGSTFTLWFPRDPIDEVLLPGEDPVELVRA